jgi:hypothetical protein
MFEFASQHILFLIDAGTLAMSTAAVSEAQRKDHPCHACCLCAAGGD